MPVFRNEEQHAPGAAGWTREGIAFRRETRQNRSQVGFVLIPSDCSRSLSRAVATGSGWLRPNGQFVALYISLWAKLTSREGGVLMYVLLVEMRCVYRCRSECLYIGKG